MTGLGQGRAAIRLCQHQGKKMPPSPETQGPSWPLPVGPFGTESRFPSLQPQKPPWNQSPAVTTPGRPAHALAPAARKRLPSGRAQGAPGPRPCHPSARGLHCSQAGASTDGRLAYGEKPGSPAGDSAKSPLPSPAGTRPTAEQVQRRQGRVGGMGYPGPAPPSELLPPPPR